jgi:UDP-N-acetylmuramyl pentapeptide phosphotransferase/UDP-N-acetylglucosamine-1-phosphate transferase
MIKLTFINLLFMGYFFAALLSPYFIRFLSQEKITGVNYQGEVVPLAGGLIFVASLLSAGLFLQFVTGQQPLELIYLTIGILAISMLGLLDDLVGNGENRGFKGHIRKLAEGKLTTGGLKAIGGGIISLYLVLPFSQNWVEIITNSFLVALAINTINLLDLRPGRAIKGFFTGLIVIFAFGNLHQLMVVGIVAGITLAYLPYDFKAKIMMGDTGSNALGLALGLTMVWGLPFTGKLLGLSILVAIHIVAEIYSISKLIEQSPVLRLLDKLGR